MFLIFESTFSKLAFDSIMFGYFSTIRDVGRGPDYVAVSSQQIKVVTHSPIFFNTRTYFFYYY